MNLLAKSHEQCLGLLCFPLQVQLLLGGGACRIVRRLQAQDQLAQGRSDFWREKRHPGGSNCDWKRSRLQLGRNVQASRRCDGLRRWRGKIRTA